MTKPIFIVRIPFSINEDKLKEQMDYVTRKLHDDYHVIPVLDNYVQQLQFECYNPNNISDKKLEELKQQLKNNASAELMKKPSKKLPPPPPPDRIIIRESSWLETITFGFYKSKQCTKNKK